MTKAEQKKRAVTDHHCPRCSIQQHFRCRRIVRGRDVYLVHPHAERVALVTTRGV